DSPDRTLRPLAVLSKHPETASRVDGTDQCSPSRTTHHVLEPADAVGYDSNRTLVQASPRSDDARERRTVRRSELPKDDSPGGCRVRHESTPMTSGILPAVSLERPLLRPWVEQAAELCRPDNVVWCDGSQAEYDRLCQILVQKGTFRRLNQEK